MNRILSALSGGGDNEDNEAGNDQDDDATAVDGSGQPKVKKRKKSYKVCRVVSVHSLINFALNFFFYSAEF